MHRTQTLDYVVVLEGKLELTLGEGNRVVKRGEVIVQRAAMHRWRDLNKTEGARSSVVSMGSESAVDGGMEFLG